MNIVRGTPGVNFRTRITCVWDFSFSLFSFAFFSFAHEQSIERARTPAETSKPRCSIHPSTCCSARAFVEKARCSRSPFFSPRLREYKFDQNKSVRNPSRRESEINKIKKSASNLASCLMIGHQSSTLLGSLFFNRPFRFLNLTNFLFHASHSHRALSHGYFFFYFFSPSSLSSLCHANLLPPSVIVLILDCTSCPSVFTMEPKDLGIYFCRASEPYLRPNWNRKIMRDQTVLDTYLNPEEIYSSLKNIVSNTFLRTALISCFLNFIFIRGFYSVETDKL